MKTLFATLLAGVLALFANVAYAQECPGGNCGTPNQSGGGCGCGCGSILVAMTDRGDTYQFADDFDGDGIEDDYDNCPFSSNYDQTDGDADEVGDACDLCGSVFDAEQRDLDGDGEGDACDADIDGDTVLNGSDVCERIPDLSLQIDTDGDLLGNACDDNDDGDPFDDADDDCPLLSGRAADNPGAICDTDPDDDGRLGNEDNCPGEYNPVSQSTGNQPDMDADGEGDECDFDLDGDGWDNFQDNCPDVDNPSQLDLDYDGAGDAGNWNTGAAESCDADECYAIPGTSGCLNPAASFEIKIRIPERLTTDDEITLGIFTNRFGELHRWTARFDRLPDDSDATIKNADCAATAEGNPQLIGACGDGPKFTPDAPGTYKVKVNVELSDGSDGLGTSMASATATMEVGGENAGGCAAVGGSWLGALALGLLFRRRKSA
jgi:hypothetical protein